MARKTIKDTTLRALFAKSGNVCAFLGCNHEMVTDKNLFVGQVCHIESASIEGPRFNSESNDEARRYYANLILLCYKHHKEIDTNVDEYSGDYLKEIKAKHESKHAKYIFEIDQSIIYQIDREMKSYWAEIGRIRREDHVIPDLAVEIETDVSPFELFNNAGQALSRMKRFTDELYESDQKISDDAEQLLTGLGYDLTAYKNVSYYDNPFQDRNWETHNLGVTNAFTDLSVILLQLEIKFLEAYLKLHSNDEVAKLRFSELKSEMKRVAKCVGYVD